MYIKKSTIFLWGCIAFLCGVGLRSAFVFSDIVFFSVVVGGLGALIVSGRWRWGILVGVVCMASGLGIIRYAWSIPDPIPADIQYYHQQKTTFIGTVVAEPDTRADHVKLTVAAEKLADGHIVHGRVLVNTKLYPQYRYGDQLSVTCQLEAPGLIESDDGRDFRYDQYLAIFRVYTVCYRPQIEVLAEGRGSPVLARILDIKQRFVERVTMAINEPEASFVGGLILGARKSIPEYLITAFNQTGTTHIIALSGYNITIIAVFIQNICRAFWIHRQYAFWISLGAIIFFVILTGAPASVTRAGIMGGLVLLARQLGQRSRITNTLALAAAAMVMINPQVLVYDAGFQLSFLSTIGLVYFSPLLERVFHWVPKTFELRASLTATLSAIIFTLPMILLTFGRLSLIAPIVNVIILPLIPFAMALGFLTGIAGFVYAPFGAFVGWIAWALLRTILAVIEWFSAIPHIAVQLPVMSSVWVVFAYGVLGFCMWMYHKKPPTQSKPAAVH